MSHYRKQQIAKWRTWFAELLPTILNYVVPAFRRLKPEARSEAVAEAVANSYVAFSRLVRCGREKLVYPTVLAQFAIKQVRAGRKVGTRLNSKDISSGYAQRKKEITIERLDRFDFDAGCWQEAIVEDHRTPVVAQAIFRIDFPAWLNRLSARDRKIAEMLAVGHCTSEVAQRVGISCGRVSQLRRELQNSWRKFQGDFAENEPMDLLESVSA